MLRPIPFKPVVRKSAVTVALLRARKLPLRSFDPTLGTFTFSNRPRG